MSALELFKSGQLQDAIASSLESVKSKPTDTLARSMLCELLCFDGNLERADKQLDSISTLAPDAVVGASLFRHIIRAEQARREVFFEGRLPEFIEPPSPEFKARLAALIAFREGNAEEVATQLDIARNEQKQLSGTLNDKPFTVFGDYDEILGSVFEALTSNGKYYWIPMEKISSVQLDPPAHIRDYLWRPIEIEMVPGVEGRLFLPLLYVDTFKQEDEKLKCGLNNDWLEDSNGLLRGLGQRVFQVGEDAVPAANISKLEFDGTNAT